MMKEQNVNIMEDTSVRNQTIKGSYILLASIVISVFSFISHSLLSGISSYVWVQNKQDSFDPKDFENLELNQTIFFLVAKAITIAFAIWIFSRKSPLFTKQSLSIRSVHIPFVLCGILCLFVFAVASKIISSFFTMPEGTEVGKTIVYMMSHCILGIVSTFVRVLILVCINLKTRSFLAIIAVYIIGFLINYFLVEKIYNGLLDSTHWIAYSIAVLLFISAIIMGIKYIFTMNLQKNR